MVVRVLQLMSALVLSAGCAQAVQCANDVLNAAIGDGVLEWILAVSKCSYSGAMLQANRNRSGSRRCAMPWPENGQTSGICREWRHVQAGLLARGSVRERWARTQSGSIGNTGPGNFSQQPNGVFLVDGHRARVLTTEEYAQEKPQPRLATQSGPMLVHQGAITTSPVMAPDSQSRRIRNGVCAPSPAEAVFVVTASAVTFYEFAEYFLNRLHCAEALYLDGIDIEPVCTAAWTRGPVVQCGSHHWRGSLKASDPYRSNLVDRMIEDVVRSTPSRAPIRSMT